MICGIGTLIGRTISQEKKMPLTSKGQKIMGSMQKQYGAEKGKQVFYASRNKGTISGVDPESSHPHQTGHSKHADGHLKRAGHSKY